MTNVEQNVFHVILKLTVERIFCITFSEPSLMALARSNESPVAQ